MPIERITADDLRDMEHQEGLVLQGCGGEAQEWLDGINDLLTQDGILQNGSRFETVKVFQHDGLNNLLFPFDDIQVDMGKLAMWRLQTHGAFGGTWLSDYVPNWLGGFRSARQENPRPLCPLLGQDGNIFHLMGIAARVLRQNGMAAEAKEKLRQLNAAGALFRVNHKSWWKEELPSVDEYETARKTLNQAGWDVDYIITHCCPSSVQDAFSGGLYRRDALTDFFDEVRERCQFKYWFFGHYHENMVVEKKFAMLYEQIICLK